MRRFLFAYLATMAAFLALDAIWLSGTMHWLYAPRIGHLLRPQPQLVAAGLFYAGYVAGVVVFAVRPAVPAGPGGALRALPLGALLGLVAYGTYDLTNLATLQGWSVLVTAADMVWGAVVTGLAALAGALASRRWAPSP